VLEEASEEDYAKEAGQIVANGSIIIARSAAEQIATKKLGEVFKAISNSDDLSEYERVLNFACIVLSKPRKWADVSQDILEKTDKGEFQLFHMLRILMKNYREDVNQISDREALKHLVALVRTKRSLGKNVPGAKPVAAMLRKLEELEQFERPAEPD
jgi:hypothetical protein